MPLYYADQVKFKVDLYNVNPSIFSLDQVDELEQAATEFGVKFQRNIAAEEAKLEPTVISTANQFISGLFEGFTTFGYAGEPGSEAEAIANKLGHLIGFVPGILGGPAVLGAKASLKVGTLLGKKAASATIAKGFTKFAKIVSGDSKIVGDLALKSVPMIGADKAIDVLGKLVKKNTSLEAMKLFAPGSVGRGMVRGAAHLGIASGISSWKGGVDEMMDSMVSGAGFGAAFAGMGNFINLQKMIADPKTLKQANTVVRGIAGSLMMGLPSTMQDAPTSMQVYEYLLGGYFGATSASSHEG